MLAKLKVAKDSICSKGSLEIFGLNFQSISFGVLTKGDMWLCQSEY